ncbi:SURF1 family protein [Sphingopyxis sp. LARHCG72]
MSNVPSRRRQDAGATPRRKAAHIRRLVFVATILALAAGLTALGVWQLERRVWKHDLIGSVAARVRAEPAPAPGRSEWRDIGVATHAYRRVRATGHFDHGRETLVQAVTDRGSGFWVLTPLKTPEFTLLVNRGFVPFDRRDPATRSAGNFAGTVTVTGLLRISEPNGGFLRSNDPAAQRWYTRDIAAIAKARHIQGVAPYFIDADAKPNTGGYPVGGLTVVRFSDNHMIYALTWFGLALLGLFFARRLWYLTPSRFHLAEE